MVPFLNQFVISFGFGTLESMIGPYLKEDGASDFDVGLVFLMTGFSLILGSVINAKASLALFFSFNVIL